MKLSQLLAGLPGVENVQGDADSCEITGITCDPNLCRTGFIYTADESETVDSTRYGIRLDGRDYIDQALASGASAILSTPEVSIPYLHHKHAVLVTHRKPLSILGPLASRIFGEPKPEQIALVTGTNGKTSTVNFCRAIWTGAGYPSCSVGNLGGVCSDGSLVWDRDPTLSVPETVTLHRMLHDIATRGFNHVALEATSHALFDNRLDGVSATVGAFTNLTRDHLDFHHTMEEYFKVKMTLFQRVIEPGKFAVLNADAEWFEPALVICKQRGLEIITFGNRGREVRLIESTPAPSGQRLKLEVFGKVLELTFPLFGEFQVSNALCALSIAIATGVPAETAANLLGTLGEVEGRLNLAAQTASGGKVIVDYAHTPDGLRAALEACRSFTKGKLLVLFGCNGDRDQGKRPQMGEIAERLADRVIITDGHPRHEDAGEIRKDILKGTTRAVEVAGRRAAIEHGIRMLGNDDTLLLAGMGHERVQVVGDQKIPFSDSEVAKEIISLLA